MSSLSVKILYGKNENLVINPSELMERYLFGVPTCTSDGRTISSQTIKTHILAAQRTVENLFSLKLNRQVIEESRDFIREEFNRWGYVRSLYPINYIDDLKGYINDVNQINYPREWLSLKKMESVAVFRNVYLIPNTGKGATMTQNAVIYNGMSPHLGWFGQTWIPNYWRLRYVTGFDPVPLDLLDFIAKLASVNVLAILGDVLYGVGLTSIQVSLDGVSQSTPLTRSAQGGIFAGRIKQYVEDMNREVQNLKYRYRGITFEVL